MKKEERYFVDTLRLISKSVENNTIKPVIAPKNIDTSNFDIGDIALAFTYVKFEDLQYFNFSDAKLLSDIFRGNNKNGQFNKFFTNFVKDNPNTEHSVDAERDVIKFFEEIGVKLNDNNIVEIVDHKKALKLIEAYNSIDKEAGKEEYSEGNFRNYALKNITFVDSRPKSQVTSTKDPKESKKLDTIKINDDLSMSISLKSSRINIYFKNERTPICKIGFTSFEDLAATMSDLNTVFKNYSNNRTTIKAYLDEFNAQSKEFLR